MFICNKFLSKLGLGLSKQNIALLTNTISDKPQVVTVATTPLLSLLSAPATIASFKWLQKKFLQTESEDDT